MHKSTVNTAGSAGSGTVTEVDTGTGLTGGPITASGTIAMATNTANTLAGFNNSGVFSDVAIGSGLSLSSGTLTASGAVSSVSNSDSTLTVSPTTGNVVASLNLGNANTWTAKQTFNTSSIQSGTLTASTALASDASKNIVSSSTTATELGYVHGVTSAIQTQLNALQPSGSYITSLTGGVTASGPGAASATVVTNANLTGPITSVGNATSVASSIALPGNPTTTTQTALTNNTTIATTAYTDAAVTAALNGLDWKQACLLATTANIVGTYLSGVFTVTATGVITIDGTAVALNNNVLFKNQTATGGSGTVNGAYVCTTAGAIGVAAVFTRRSDYNTSAEIQTGDTFFIQSGTANGGTAWSLTTAPPIVLDTTALTFSQVSGPGTYVAGTGLTLTGNSFSVNTSQSIATLSNLTSNGVVGTTGGGGTLGVTAINGTGNIVATTNAALTTPNIGTPSAGTLTNCTGLPVAGGGTGDASFTVYAPIFGGTTTTGALQSGTVGTAGQRMISNGAGALPTFQTDNGLVRTIGFSAVTPVTGQQGSYVVFPVAGTITGWSIVVDTGTATVQTWKIGTGTTAPTSGNSISTSGVSLSTGSAITSSTVTDFTSTTVSANDIFAFNLSAVASATKILFELQITIT